MNTNTKDQKDDPRASVVFAGEDSVTVMVRGVNHTISWGTLHSAAWQGGELGGIYARIEEEAKHRLWLGQLKKLSDLGYGCRGRQVGQRFGSEGVIFPSGRPDVVVYVGPLCPFDSSTAIKSAVNGFLRARS